jgi:DNA polymerase-3 subunit epsilon
VGQAFIDFCGQEAVLVAHNNDSFDLPFLKCELARHGLSLPSWPCLDSLKWSRKYRPDLPRHSLQHLREVYGIPANEAHRALDDVITLYKVFSLMTDDLPPVLLLTLLSQTKPLECMPFGKYQGRPLADVPKDYVAWLRSSGALDKPENIQLKLYFDK